MTLSGVRVGAWILALCGLSACGGGDGGIGDPGFGGDRSELREWESGMFRSRNDYINYCASPRSGTDPFNNDQPYPDRQGTEVDEKFFLRSWNNDVYLWYDEVEDVNPNNEISVLNYFDLLKTDRQTPSGVDIDQFHFAQDTFEYKRVSVAGETFGYGFQVAILEASPPRDIRIRKVLEGSPADTAGITRGMLITEIDGVDAINGSSQEDVDVLNQALFPSVLDEDHNFVFSLPDAPDLELTLSSARLETDPVSSTTVIETPTGNVGYVYFDDHSFPSELELRDAFTTLSAAGVDDLVLDLRDNGGGLLFVSSQVGHMIAGDAGRNNVFYEFRYNDKRTRDNQAFGFFDTVQGSVDTGQSLPTLNLPRVFIISTGRTCSASEAIINGLLGVGIDVILIGSNTCGKPYGFLPQDNCGTTYFSIEFAGVNDEGFGDYAAGFKPNNENDAPGIALNGCFVRDDFARPFGNPDEVMLAAALQYRADGSCPATATAVNQKQALSEKPSIDAPVIDPLHGVRTNLLVLPEHLPQ